MAKVSVIVPVYNVEKYLKQCLDSIVDQTLEDLEIVLVDDGSVDSSGTICDEYAKKDTRIRVIHKENGGLSETQLLQKELFQKAYYILNWRCSVNISIPPLPLFDPAVDFSPVYEHASTRLDRHGLLRPHQ